MIEEELIEEYVRKTEKYTYVSFDLFDTLIFRTFKDPADVFDAVEHIYKTIYGKKLNNFRKVRHNAELKARRKNTDSGRQG